MENQDKKRELIIEAALKRFAHFGLNKTTMSEIAADISFSKALLYYYFPDKISLFSAVMDTIIRRIEKEMQEGLSKQSSSHDAILFYLDKRQEFVRKYFYLIEFAISVGAELPAELVTIFKNSRSSEVASIASIIERGNSVGEFNVVNPALTAEILLDALAGMRLNHFGASKSFYPDKDQFEQILLKEKQLAVIFLKGLTK
ncbi:TetR/AcrR family transcriptional regulator [Rubrolithibacter danxiaensis]|uniref:TetR/AcrR family transcriptional regulator n=1 Tax=Rubrolithibacter danxiaensis TaxID=3390805 RepID=UPI003BF85367